MPICVCVHIQLMMMVMGNQVMVHLQTKVLEAQSSLQSVVAACYLKLVAQTQYQMTLGPERQIPEDELMTKIAGKDCVADASDLVASNEAAGVAMNGAQDKEVDHRARSHKNVVVVVQEGKADVDQHNVGNVRLHP